MPAIELINIGYQHHLFYFAPSLQTDLIALKQNLIDDCMSWMKTKNISCDWRLHLQLLKWMQPYHPSKDIIHSCLQAACIRWSMQGFDYPRMQGMVISSILMPKQAIGIIKSSQPDQTHRIIRFTLTHEISSLFQYALISDPAALAPLNWQTLEIN